MHTQLLTTNPVPTPDQAWQTLWRTAQRDLEASDMEWIGNPIASDLFDPGVLTRVTLNDGRAFLVIGQQRCHSPSNIILSHDVQHHSITVAGDFSVTVGRMVAKFFDRRYQVADRMMVSANCKTCEKLDRILSYLQR